MDRLWLETQAYRSDAPRDGLGASADPVRYVALPSAERALTSVVEAVEAARSPILVEGVGGTGKTLLLRVLAGRIRFGTRRVAFSPFLHLPPGDVARWLLHLLGRDPGPDGEAAPALLADVRRHEGGPTILLVDEIQGAPEASVQRLVELARAGGQRIVLVAAGTPGPGLDAARSLLQPELRVSLPSALPTCEMTQLCDALLSDRALPEALRELSPEARAAVVRGAAGVPGLLTAELTRRAHDASGLEGEGGAAPLRSRAERSSARRGPTEIISVPLLDTVRGPNPPPAVRFTPVTAPRPDPEEPPRPTASPRDATQTPALAAARAPRARVTALRARARQRAAALGSAGAGVLRDAGAAMRRALADAGGPLRRLRRGSAASDRWTRVEDAASRQTALPRAPAPTPLPRAQPSTAPWLPRSQTPVPSPLPRADLAAATPPAPVVRAAAPGRRPARVAALRRAARAGRGAASAISSGARATLRGLSSAAARAVRGAASAVSSGARATLRGLSSAAARAGRGRRLGRLVGREDDAPRALVRGGASRAAAPLPPSRRARG